jgi:hypothetical protein
MEPVVGSYDEGEPGTTHTSIASNARIGFGRRIGGSQSQILLRVIERTEWAAEQGNAEPARRIVTFFVRRLGAEFRNWKTVNHKATVFEVKVKLVDL